jgi:DNA polymerase-3 subunit beta
MKVKCSRAALSEAFGLAAAVVPVRTTIPAVMNIKLTASKEGKGASTLEVVATDLEYGIRYLVTGVDVKEEGTLVLPASRMAGILREVSDADVTIDSDGTLAQIKTSDAAFKVVGVDPVDYPAIPGFEEKGSVKVATDDLGEMIRKTQFAVSSEVVRYALTGQLLEVKGKELRMVASDGKRLAFIRSKSSSKESAQKDLRVIVPTKTLNLLDKVLTDKDEFVQMQVEETQIKLKSSRAVIFSRLIDGNFPDYEAVIPQDRDRKVSLNREALHAAVRKVALVTTEKTRAVKLSFGKGKLKLFARTQDVGEASVELPVEWKGEECEVVFNPDFIADYLKVVSEAEVELHLKDRSSAGVFKAGKDYTYVLMPLTVSL